jgi:hypothetical protein
MEEMIMRIVRVIALTGLLTTSLMIVTAPSSSASNDSHKADLTGYEEVPAVSSTGTGRFRIKIDENSQRIDYDLSYENLEGTTTTASHIHLGQRSVNGGVAAWICGGGGKPACTNTAGEFSGFWTPVDVVGPAGQGLAPGEFAELVRAIRAGMVYVNVHTNKHPGGEIRGQVK